MAFWIHDPTALMASDHVFELWPTADMTTHLKLNAITRLVVVMSLLGYLLTKNARFAIIGAITIAAVVMYQMYLPPLKEGMEARIDSNEYTTPTAANPLMNVLLPEINGPPKKPALPYNSETATVINKKVVDQLGKNVDPRIFRGTNNELDLEYSMRNFYTTASTTTPNDQAGFSEFLYGDMPSAKEGDPMALLKHNARLGPVNV
jgi:hypothetical protein